jgi:hypothetical protein
MSDADGTETIDEILLRGGTPSELHRAEERLAGAGAASELARTKQTLAALSLAVSPRPAASGRARLVASLARKGRYGAFADRIARLFDLPLAKAEEYMQRIADPEAWRPGFVPGMLAIPVRPGPKYQGESSAVAGFGKLVPGWRFPHHDHVGDETTIVLEGGFRSLDDGRETWRGDELWKPAGSDHEFVVLDGPHCIAAVLAERGVTFR